MPWKSLLPCQIKINIQALIMVPVSCHSLAHLVLGKQLVSKLNIIL